MFRRLLWDKAKPALSLSEPRSVTMAFLWKQAKWGHRSRRAGSPQYWEDTAWAGQAGLGCLLSVLAHPSAHSLQLHNWAHHDFCSPQQPLHLPVLSQSSIHHCHHPQTHLSGRKPSPLAPLTPASLPQNHLKDKLKIFPIKANLLVPKGSKPFLEPKRPVSC